MEKGQKFDVLDNGYVKLIDFMGPEESIVEAARMSTGKGFISWEPYGDTELDGVLYKGRADGDLGFLEFLYENKHMTPFEMCELLIEVQAPIFVFREWHRHRTQSYNEFSARYAQMPNIHYLPAPVRIQKQGKKNKQGSDEVLPYDEAMRIINALDVEQQGVYNNYDKLVKDGVAKEIARINTPVARYSRMRAKANLRNWLAFLYLRKPSNAQWEIRQFADIVGAIVSALWPRTYALFEEHDLHGTKFSRTEMTVLREMVKMLQAASPTSLKLAYSAGLPEKRYSKFLEKLDLKIGQEAA